MLDTVENFCKFVRKDILPKLKAYTRRHTGR